MDDYEIRAETTVPLGDTSYLLVSGGQAVLIDPQRDCWDLLASCESRDARVRYVLETHVHNDYLTGALEVRSETGATVAGPARAAYAFDYLPMAEGGEIEVGDVLIQAMETPGHTAEHTSYLLFTGSQPDPAAVFTGGCLMVGSSGRTDLSGEENTAHLAHDQYRSIRRLARLPDATRVLPTHGAGSACAAGPADAARTTTVGAERTSNPALLDPDETHFVSAQLAGLPPYPAYYRHMAELNRAGPRVLHGPPAPRPLPPDAVAQLIQLGAAVVDGRDRTEFTASHLPGALSDELDDSFATTIGQVVPFGTPLVLVLPEPERDAAREAAVQLMRIGYENIGGYLEGGVARWHDSGRALVGLASVDVSEVVLGDPRVCVLDVRSPTEPGTIPGALVIPVGELPGRLGEVPRGREVWTVCSRGRRAATAASLLERAGYPVTAVITGGAADLVTERRKP
jgi:glyoxylase-like metal-dependent hydrolase (beta-lactamase superfamily II)/rhodanese-related sulfurtransferase